MKMKNHIPNIITCLNLLSGVFSLICTLYVKNLDWAIYCIFASAIFDFFDGFFARLLNAYSPIGADLDSLSDLVSFGLAPSFLLFLCITTITEGQVIFGFPAFLIVCFSALRLAKFNNDTRQKNEFIGLPVPASALFWIGWSVALTSLAKVVPLYFTLSLTYLCILGISIAMISELPMVSLKLKNFAWKKNKDRYLLIVIFIISVVLFSFKGLCIAIVYYLLSSFFSRNKLRED